MTPANDNFWIEDTNKNKSRIPDGWQNYTRVEMTCYGPIGVIGGEFAYLDGRAS